MLKIVEVILLVIVPVAWGMSIHCVFELFRRRRAGRQAITDSAPIEDQAP